MALINCTECGKEVSDKASSCPNCGCPIEIIKNESNINNKEFENIVLNDVKCTGNRKDDISSCIFSNNTINNKKTLNLKKEYISFGASILSIFLFIIMFFIPEKYIALGNVVLFLNVIPVIVGIVSIFKIPKREKGRWAGLIGIIISGFVLCVSVSTIFDGDSQNIQDKSTEIAEDYTNEKFENVDDIQLGITEEELENMNIGELDKEKNKYPEYIFNNVDYLEYPATFTCRFYSYFTDLDKKLQQKTIEIENIEKKDKQKIKDHLAKTYGNPIHKDNMNNLDSSKNYYTYENNDIFISYCENNVKDVVEVEWSYIPEKVRSIDKELFQKLEKDEKLRQLYDTM